MANFRVITGDDVSSFAFDDITFDANFRVITGDDVSSFDITFDDITFDDITFESGDLLPTGGSMKQLPSDSLIDNSKLRVTLRVYF
ncbi:hypothetical protein QE152_g29316 [Popillia japonica]|uniref:Uncharacterized protein n=1 Tax=Popillia japonica TaxID=7064 RepID=A0AAW1JI55_POPJA